MGNLKDQGPYGSRSGLRPALVRALDGSAKAVLVVASDPLISGVAADLLSLHRLRRRSFSIAKSELVCLTRQPLRKRWDWAWSIVPGDEEQEAALREKIKSKTTIATALGGLIVALLTVLMKEVVTSRPNWWQWSATLLLALSGMLYFATLFLYDTLQMPTRFWGTSSSMKRRGLRFGFPRSEPGSSEGQPKRDGLAQDVHSWLGGDPLPSRPPSSTARVMHAAMVHVWRRIFTPATVLLGLAVGLLIAGAGGDIVGLSIAIDPLVVVGVFVGSMALALAWVYLQRPRLGHSD